MDILIPTSFKKSQQEIFDERRNRLSAATKETREAREVAKLKEINSDRAKRPSVPKNDEYTKPVPPQKQIRNRDTLDSIAMANNAVGRVVVRKTKSEFEVHAMRNDWDVAAYDKHNKCPVCHGVPLEDNVAPSGRGRKSTAQNQASAYTLLLTRKLASEQDFVCKNCKSKFKLIKDVRIEGKFGTHWRDELEVM